MLGKSGGNDSVTAALCSPLTRAIAEPPAAGGPPGSVSAGIWKSRRDSRSGPAIVKLNSDGGMAPRVSVVRPDSRRQVTTSPGVNGKSGRNVSVRRSLDRRSLPSCEPDTDPLMTSGAPPVIEPASTIPPGRRMTFVSGRIQEEPGSGERNSRPGDCASTPDAGYMNIDAATGIATTRTRVRRVIEGIRPRSWLQHTATRPAHMPLCAHNHTPSIPSKPSILQRSARSWPVSPVRQWNSRADKSHEYHRCHDAEDQPSAAHAQRRDVTRRILGMPFDESGNGQETRHRREATARARQKNQLRAYGIERRAGEQKQAAGQPPSLRNPGAPRKTGIRCRSSN